MINRTKTRQVKFSGIKIGGQKHIVIQSMTNTKTHDIKKTLEQIYALKKSGCELVRVAVFDDNDSNALKILVKKSPLPIIADIHFNFEYALNAIKSGVPKIRLNPGNLDDPKKLTQICELANKYNTIIRIGVNSGSLPKWVQQKFSDHVVQIIETANHYINLLNKNNFYNIVLSLKSSDPLTTIKAYELASKTFPYPLHLGVTEAGIYDDAIIKSVSALSPLLINGIGDTIRISITGDPVDEVYVARKLLNVLGLRNDMVDIISCPTCGRLNYDMHDIVKKIKDYTININKPIKISVLGCVVNGIGEGQNSDIGLAGSFDKVILFKRGKIHKTISSKDSFMEIKKLIDEFVEEN